MQTDHSEFLQQAAGLVGTQNLLTGDGEMAKYVRDWTGRYGAPAVAVARPGSTAEVATIVRLASRNKVAVVPQGGNTGLAGGGVPRDGEAAVVLSLDRMQRIRALDVDARIAVVDAGLVVQALQDSAAAKGLLFPLTFGARGSCTMGGVLSTNAGGSNVLRYGTARALCLGIEAVLPDGSVIDTLSGLRKDNTGYDLRDLLIGAEGTLGVITGATMRLYPALSTRVTCFASLPSLSTAWKLLNMLEDASGGFLEAFEYMPSAVVATVCKHVPQTRPPLASPFDAGILFEVGSVHSADARPDDRGTVPLRSVVEAVLADAFERGLVLDAVLAETERHRSQLWAMREAVLEAVTAEGPARHLDIALPLGKVTEFLDAIGPATDRHGLRHLTIGHLGDGNLHVAICPRPGAPWPAAEVEAVETFAYDLVQALGGSVSAEHGIGQHKREMLAVRKPTSQLAAMRAIKAALDPQGIMNPGKMLPDIGTLLPVSVGSTA